jgi:oligosaccharide repeat unit polymerase
MQIFLITIFTVLSIASFWQFLRGKYKLSPLWLMLSAWFIAIAISQLHLSTLETVWPGWYWFLLAVSLTSFCFGFFVIENYLKPASAEKEKQDTNNKKLRYVIYILFIISLGALYLFYKKAGNFPLLAPDPDEFRFAADEKVPGLINYAAQLARVFIPLSFFLFFKEIFNWRKHWELVVICLIGTGFLIVFASRTQIFFIDLWVMGLYLLMRKPNLKQALKFYPFFLLVSIIVLAAVPMIRQYKSYGDGYLANITGIDTSRYNKIGDALIPIYVGVSFNQQALLHAEDYYQDHLQQHGKVSLDPFTNIFGKIITPLHRLKSNYDLGAIFYSWWNTGTYLFPFVQDFGTAAFYIIPFIIAGILTLSWRYWQTNPNFLSINLYAYAMFFIVMTVYLSFTVRAEMYLDLMLLFVVYKYVSTKVRT